MSHVADALHTFYDGVSVGAAYQVSPASDMATTPTVLLHEVPQELGEYMLLPRGAFSRPTALAANLAFALSALLGTWTSLTLGVA